MEPIIFPIFFILYQSDEFCKPWEREKGKIGRKKFFREFSRVSPRPLVKFLIAVTIREKVRCFEKEKATAKSKKQSGKTQNAETDVKVVCENRKARHDYEILETIECGIALVGSEVKSLREGRCSLAEAYAKFKNGEIWLYSCDIQEYLEANRLNHQPKRPRKLLLHRTEIHRCMTKTAAKGFTLIPLKIYFQKHYAKVLLGICQGKQEHDKRQALKNADMDRRIKLNMLRYTQR